MHKILKTWTSITIPTQLYKFYVFDFITEDRKIPTPTNGKNSR